MYSEETLQKRNFFQLWGGLGDNIAFSNLPCLYNQQGLKFMYLLNHSRNSEVSNIVDNNPYVENLKLLLPNSVNKEMKSIQKHKL